MQLLLQPSHLPCEHLGLHVQHRSHWLNVAVYTHIKKVQFLRLPSHTPSSGATCDGYSADSGASPSQQNRLWPAQIQILSASGSEAKVRPVKHFILKTQDIIGIQRLFI